MGKRKNWPGSGGDAFIKDAWDLYDLQGDLGGLGPRTDPESGNIYRVRKGDKNTFNPEKRTGLRIQPVNPVEGVSKGITASGKDRQTRINKATITQKEVIRDAKALFKENGITKFDGQTATQYGKAQHNKYLSDLKNAKVTTKLGGNTAAHIVPTTDSSFIESADNYYSETLSKNAADQARVPTPRQRRLTGTNLTRTQFIRQRILGFGQDKPTLSNLGIKTILDKSKIKVPSSETMRKGGWTRVMSRSRRVLNTGGDNPRTNLTGNVQSLQPFNQLMENTYPQDFIHESGIVPPIPLV